MWQYTHTHDSLTLSLRLSLSRYTISYVLSEHCLLCLWSSMYFVGMHSNKVTWPMFSVREVEKWPCPLRKLSSTGTTSSKKDFLWSSVNLKVDAAELLCRRVCVSETMVDLEPWQHSRRTSFREIRKSHYRKTNINQQHYIAWRRRSSISHPTWQDLKSSLITSKGRSTWKNGEGFLTDLDRWVWKTLEK